MTRALFIALLFLVNLGCTSQPVNKAEGLKYGYDLTEPSEKIKLSGILTEISGLAYLGDDQLVCVQDEEGIVFIYDLKKEKIDKKRDFAKDADYEGIAYTGKKVYVLRSNGDIIKVKDLKKNPDKKVYKTALTQKYDTEGLCYDQVNNRLLIACKGKAGAGKKYKHKKAVYSFDLETKELDEKPVFLVNLKKLKKHLKQTSSTEVYEQLAAFFDPHEGNITFQPSGIEVHPLTGDIYLISSVGKLMLILDAQGNIKAILPLPRDTFKQPEGITFDASGNLFISNEGRDGKANILRFNYQKPTP